MTFEEWSKTTPSMSLAEKSLAKIAWDAACEACARNQQQMLRSMVSRGDAADKCRVLKSL